MLIKYLLKGRMRDFHKKVWHLIPAAYMDVVSVPSKCILFIEEKKSCNSFIVKLVKLNMKDESYFTVLFHYKLIHSDFHKHTSFFSWLQSYVREHLEKAWQ